MSTRPTRCSCRRSAATTSSTPRRSGPTRCTSTCSPVTGDDDVLGGAGSRHPHRRPRARLRRRQPRQRHRRPRRRATTSSMWDPGDGSDVVEGRDGEDLMTFNGAGGAEIFAATAERRPPGVHPQRRQHPHGHRRRRADRPQRPRRRRSGHRQRRHRHRPHVVHRRPRGGDRRRGRRRRSRRRHRRRHAWQRRDQRVRLADGAVLVAGLATPRRHPATTSRPTP